MIKVYKFEKIIYNIIYKTLEILLTWLLRK